MKNPFWRVWKRPSGFEAVRLWKAQINFIGHAFFLFFVFLTIFAPLEYHFHWWHAWRHAGALSFGDALLNPLPSGLLYFYSVIIAIEALSVVAIYPEIKTHIPGMSWVNRLLWVPIGMFVFEYMVSGNYPTPWNSVAPSPIPADALEWQWLTAIAALTLSLAVHLAAILFEARKVENRRVRH